METNDQKKNISTLHQLTRDSKFKFRCHKEISCFTKCCSGIKIVLTPYDILRMKKRLDMTSGDFLLKYTVPETLEPSGLPVATLKMQENENKGCPFVTPEGCTIYSDRPATCRYYPIGFAMVKEEKVDKKDEFFFFVKEDHCRGFEEDKEWTVQSWREDQEPDLYDRMNKDWTEILMKKQTMGPVETPDKSLQLFFMVSYDLDQFRRFVFESSFLEKYEIPEKFIEKMRNNDEELQRFGLRWLKSTLFGEKFFQEKRS